MEGLTLELTAAGWIFSLLVALVAGLVKGAVGFALPMVIVSGLGSILPAELAIAGMLIPTLVGNLWQMLRGGLLSLGRAAQAHRRYLAIFLVVLLFSAQLVGLVPGWLLFLILGTIFATFALLQLWGWTLAIPPARRSRAEVFVALFAGLIGGFSGSWGPPTVAYLTALETEKKESVIVQGLVYGAGAILLVLAHLRSGLLGPETAPFSAALVVPVVIGMAIGMAIQDRMDQTQFRRVTLIVLVVAGLNLVRRGLGY